MRILTTLAVKMMMQATIRTQKKNQKEAARTQRIQMGSQVRLYLLDRCKQFCLLLIRQSLIINSKIKDRSLIVKFRKSSVRSLRSY